MRGVSNPQGLLRVTWSDKWALLKEYNVFLNYFIDGRGTATPGNHTNWLNMLWKGQFGLHFPFLRYLHLESCWEARCELGLALRRSNKFSAVEWSLHCTRFGHNSRLLWPGIITTAYWWNNNGPDLAPMPTFVHFFIYLLQVHWCTEWQSTWNQVCSKNVPLLEPLLNFQWFKTSKMRPPLWDVNTWLSHKARENTEPHATAHHNDILSFTSLSQLTICPWKWMINAE